MELEDYLGRAENAIYARTHLTRELEGVRKEFLYTRLMELMSVEEM